MDKNAIKKYAVWARTELIDRVSQKALQYGITEKDSVPASATSVNGVVLSKEEMAQRKALLERIAKRGYKQVMEEVAYTWFNRFSALRFMEVNGYLPSRVRVFTDENNQFEPQIIAEAIDLEMDGLDMEKVYAFKDANDKEGLFKYLIIVQCNALSPIIPGMFQRIADYTELLFPDNLLREGSAVQRMIEWIPEEDWKDQVQIIGWLYQFYNIEPKAEVFAKSGKISKEEIPAATQLFTPDWIVRYMVENSLGRLWIEGHPDENLRAGWTYYLDEAEQEPEVKTQLEKIRKEYAGITPEQIKCIDPCSGSGHICAYMFDVLMQIYEAYGYTAREAVRSIVENNIYGLDIDERAAQLAYFSVMMKARQYDRRYLTRKDEDGKPDVPQPRVYEIVESNGLDRSAVEHFVGGDPAIKKAMNSLIAEMHDAKEYGSILNITPVDFIALYRRFDEVLSEPSIFNLAIETDLLPFVKMSEVLTMKYDVSVTNPPYMGNMPVKMTDYVQKNYADSKYDLFSVFIEKCLSMTKKNGFGSLITQHTWMFISSFEKMRNKLLSKDYISIVHLGTRAFEEISGEVVQTVATVWRNTQTENNKVVACRLVDYNDAESKQIAYLEGKNRYYTKQNYFSLLPGNPVVYWLADPYFQALQHHKLIEKYVERKAGVVTGNDNYFLRLWFEPSFKDISFTKGVSGSYGKYHVMSKGGSARRFYGNYEYVIRLNDLWDPTKTNASVRRGDAEYYFKKAVGWSQVGNAQKTFRHIENSVCGTATPTIYLKDGSLFNYILGFLNTKIAFEMLAAYNPTINLLTTDICNLPLIVSTEYKDIIDSLVEECENICRIEWDSYETSWDFRMHPFVRWSRELWDATAISADMHYYYGEHPKVSCPLELCFMLWQGECNDRFNRLKSNEEELNRIFIEIYGLQDELSPRVEDKNITVRRADLSRDIRSFISYAVGCIFGRYSLDVDGLAFAGGEWDESKYATFRADKDNILPICDDDYFKDDIVGLFVKFVERVYGKDSLEDNLRFIADALGGKGAPRDVIRSYFLNEFYADHCATYSGNVGKRPIYWLFDSGKKNGFKALVYMHRYQPDTIARMRTDYVHEQQARYRTAIADLEQRIASASTSERVKLSKRLKTLQEQATEIQAYEEKIHHLADQYISIDLDDGVKVNYAKFQDVLAKIK